MIRATTSSSVVPGESRLRRKTSRRYQVPLPGAVSHSALS